jgi:hypothetical protein
MHEHDLLHIFLDPLHELGLSYVVTGLDSFNRWAIENYRNIKIGENYYRIASPEYVIIH